MTREGGGHCALVTEAARGRQRDGRVATSAGTVGQHRGDLVTADTAARGTAHRQRRNDILQFPDIARPAVATERGHRDRREHRACGHARTCRLPEGVRQQRNVFNAIPQRWHAQSNDGQPEDQILSIHTLPDRRVQ